MLFRSGKPHKRAASSWICRFGLRQSAFRRPQLAQLFWIRTCPQLFDCTSTSCTALAWDALLVFCSLVSSSVIEKRLQLLVRRWVKRICFHRKRIGRAECNLAVYCPLPVHLDGFGAAAVKLPPEHAFNVYSAIFLPGQEVHHLHGTIQWLFDETASAVVQLDKGCRFGAPTTSSWSGWSTCE